MGRRKKDKPLWQIAEAALKKAVYQAIQDHAKTGDSVVFFKNGKVIEIPATKLHLKKPGK